MDTSVLSLKSLAESILDVSVIESPLNLIPNQKSKQQKLQVPPKEPEVTNNEIEKRLTYPEKYNIKLRRSLTTVVQNNVFKIQPKEKVKPVVQKKEYISETINPILFKLNFKLQPGEVRYNKKQLKTKTLVFKSDKGRLKFKINETSPLAFPAKKKLKSTYESSEQLILSSENLLSDFYSQSIRLQNNLKKKEYDKKLNLPSLSSISHKLHAINQAITNEQTRISKSYFTL